MTYMIRTAIRFTHGTWGLLPALVALMLTVGLLPFCMGCAAPAETESDSINLVTTILPLGDFAKQVGGDRVTVTVMVPPGASPHTHEPTPGQMIAVSEADIYVKAGSGIEFEIIWMDKLIDQNRDMLVVDCSEGISILDGDPHIWNSPINASRMVETIRDGLIAIDPDGKDLYSRNCGSCNAQLAELDSYVKASFSGFTERYFMMYHPSFGYLAHEYQLTQVAVEYEGKSPTPQVLQDIVDIAKTHHLNYLFAGAQMSPYEAEGVAEAINVEIVTVDPLPADYISNMRAVADAIAMELE
ncbi:MAG: zinc ABC transporter substrate-binding protein [Dehalococcoidia bacterium]|nr:zinc ABC transporter substrate-binding protein [Dehalococcoidia bacterium]